MAAENPTGGDRLSRMGLENLPITLAVRRHKKLT